MNNIDILREQILARPQIFGLSAGISSADIGISVSLPSYDGNRDGRIRYLIYVGRHHQPALIAQSGPVWIESMANINPYRPALPSLQAAADLLPMPNGVVENGSRPIFWARYVGASMLSDILSESRGMSVVEALCKRLQQPPWHPAQRLQGGIDEYIIMLDAVCDGLPELKLIREHLKVIMIDQWYMMRFGFSHGDLWCKNVLVSMTNQFHVIDWEWAATCRPVSFDQLDLALSVVKTVYGLSHEESFTCLMKGKGEVETRVRNLLKECWNEIGYAAQQIRLTIYLYLIWAQYRLMMQTKEHRLTDNRDMGLCLSICFQNTAFLQEIES